MQEFFLKIANAAEVELGPPRMSMSVSAYDFVQAVLGVVTKLAIPAFVVLIAYFGFHVIASFGNSEDLSSAKHKLIWGLVAMAVFLVLRMLNTILFNTGALLGYVAMLVVVLVALLFVANRLYK